MGLMSVSGSGTYITPSTKKTTIRPTANPSKTPISGLLLGGNILLANCKANKPSSPPKISAKVTLTSTARLKFIISLKNKAGIPPRKIPKIAPNVIPNVSIAQTGAE